MHKIESDAIVNLGLKGCPDNVGTVKGLKYSHIGVNSLDTYGGGNLIAEYNKANSRYQETEGRNECY